MPKASISTWEKIRDDSHMGHGLDETWGFEPHHTDSVLFRHPHMPEGAGIAVIAADTVADGWATCIVDVESVDYTLEFRIGLGGQIEIRTVPLGL